MVEQPLQASDASIRSRDRECLARAADDASALVRELRALAEARDPLLAELALHELTTAVALMKDLSRMRAVCAS